MAILKVKTKYGVVSGVEGKDRSYSVFRGIPFAKPPVGELRFTPPQEPDCWDGELVCDRFSAAPMQQKVKSETFEISEDCLYLNVYTPAESGDEKLPVMFWIYGGAFQHGRGSAPLYDGGAICKKGCILVTINYRVSIFGFFNTPELEERNGRPMNFGTLDQLAALTWVQENIEAFGGDPSRVMIFGQSAGGVSTRILLTSPLSVGKFSRAVAHSGGGLNEADLVRPAKEFTALCTRAMEYLGWTFEDVMNKDAQIVLDEMNEAAAQTIDIPDLAYYQPFIDGYTITDVPGVNIYNGNILDVPVMCGTVSGDSWMFTRKVLKELQGNDSYFRAFAYSPGVAWGRRYVKMGYPAIYTYYMDRKQPPMEHVHWRNGNPPYGVDTTHGSELGYIFGTLDTVNPNYPEYDFGLAEILRTYWTNFAKTGNPNGDGLPKWPKFTADTPYFMHIGEDENVAEDPIKNDDEKKVIEFCETHPGMLTTLEEFWGS